MDGRASREGTRPGLSRLSRGGLLALALAALPQPGCAFAVDHPAVTAGAVGGVAGFGICKLDGVDYPPCLGVGAGAGVALALVAATALWLGGDGHSVLVEEQAKPLPEDGRPIKRHKKKPGPAEPAPADSPAAPPASTDAPAVPASPTAPAVLAPAQSPAPPQPAPPS